MNSEGYIKFYNCFMDNGDSKLTPIDWYWYSLIAARWNPFLNISEISISRLTEIQSYYNNKKESINRCNVKDKVFQLHDKGIITVITPPDELIANQKGEFNYNKTLEIAFNNFDGQFQMIPKTIYDKTNDIYENYALCCIYRIQKWHESKKRKNGFEKTLTGWADQLSCGEDMAKDVLDRMISKKIIDRKGWNKKQLENGQYKSTPYEYFVKEDVTEEINNIHILDPQNKIEPIPVNLPEYIEVEIYQGKNKITKIEKFKTQDIIDDIFTWGSNLFYQHFYYANKYQIEDPKTFKQYMKRKEALDGKFDFSSFERQWEKDLRYEEHKKRKELEKNTNAITYYNSEEKIYVTKDNVDFIDFDQVERIYYLRDTTLNDATLIKVAGIDYNNRNELTLDQFQFIVDEYKKIVHSGQIATIEHLIKIREEVQAL